jgi:CBS domain-containing membrane protein
MSGSLLTPTGASMAFMNRDTPPAGVRSPFRLFVPILAGATLRERVVACVGALLAVAAAAAIGASGVRLDPSLPAVMAPAGASAVLLFAIPASPMAQPWSIVGGNTISALVGILVASLVPNVALAAGLACALAIIAMTLARCLHPPGGAVAVTAVIGGPAIAAAGYSFALTPVALDSAVLVVLGLVFHRICGRSYPHRPPVAAPNPAGTSDPPPVERVGFRGEDVDAALAQLGETFDIDRADLARVLREVERQALLRTHADLTCADLMSRDVVTVPPEADAATVTALLLRHRVRVLPVVAADGRVAGMIGLRDLAAAGPDARAGEAMRPAATAAEATPALSLITAMTDGHTHAVAVVGPEEGLVGLVTQTDLLAALARRPT